MRPVEYYKNREQTYLKHFFLEQYLETVAYHIGYWNREFVYVDCFSGPWRADDEELGDTSIRIALAKLNAVKVGLARQGKTPKIRAIFVEKSPTAFSLLEKVLAEYKGEIETTAIFGDFEGSIPRLLREVKDSFSFFFVDPTGWKGFSMESLRPILRRNRGEVMINFMYDFINRFLAFENAANQDSLDRCFGTGEWRELLKSPDREAALVGLYCEQVRKTGQFAFATYTRILKPLHERAYFHLVYATRGAKGIEEFRDVERRLMAEQDSVRENRQRNRREEDSRQPELFSQAAVPSRALLDERERRLREARDRTITLLADGPDQYGSLMPRVLELPLVFKADFNEILRSFEKAGRLVIERQRPGSRAINSQDTIRLV